MNHYSYPGSETIHRVALPNGIVTLVYQNAAVQSVVIDGCLRAGALGETREKAGLASFTADMLLRGSEKYSYQETFEELESVGAALNISGNRHITDFSGRCLAEDLPLLLDILSSSLRQPSFSETQIEQIRGEILTSLQMRANDTGRMASLAFRELLYREHPYGRSVDGYEETIGGIQRSDLSTFHRRFYGPEEMIITIVGAIEPAIAVAYIEDFFGDWKTEQEALPQAPPAARPQETRRIFVPVRDKSQSNIILGLPGPLRSASDYLEASMANTILGVFGMMGRLGQNVREKQGLAYTIFSQLSGGLGPAPWIIGTGVAPENVDRVIEAILTEVKRLQTEPIPVNELADCQAYRSGLLPVSLETNGAIASVISDIELDQLGIDYLHQLPGRLMAMTPESVQAAAIKYLSTEQIAISIAGPNQILDELK